MSRYIYLNGRYIYLNELVRRVEDSNKSAGLHTEDYRKIKKWMRESPSIDIVRCRECKHWNMVSNGCMRNPSVEGWQADDYCSYGERKEKCNE